MKLKTRPLAGALVVPYVVDEAKRPIDFKALDMAHVDRCLKDGRCGVCGGKIRRGPVAFIGPDDGRDCFADPWMHVECAELAMQQCPFLAAKKGWREEGGALVEVYERNMVLYTATGWHGFKDALGHHHYHATHGLEKVA